MCQGNAAQHCAFGVRVALVAPLYASKYNCLWRAVSRDSPVKLSCTEAEREPLCPEVDVTGVQSARTWLRLRSS